MKIEIDWRLKMAKKISKEEMDRRLDLFRHQTHDYYEDIELDGDIYVKWFHAGVGRWIVSKFNPESFERYSGYNWA